jgi:CheY-like chemotaxis protein
VIGEDIALETSLGNVSRVKADPGQLGQVLMNLIVNARDAMPRGGRIWLRTRQERLTGSSALADGVYTVLEVEDTGVGMTDEVRAKIFEPFFTTKKNGTGLGLATVYGIVQQCGGEIKVVSAPGRGSTFTIYLPATTEDLDGAAPRTADAARGGESILVVEDEDIVRRIVTKRLQSAGYRVVEARNGPHAIEVCATAGSVDLILTDVVMPGLNGVEVVGKVRERFPNAAVLFMSGYPEDIIAHHGVLLRGIDFIDKSDLPKRLLLKVREVLNRWAGRAS